MMFAMFAVGEGENIIISVHGDLIRMPWAALIDSKVRALKHLFASVFPTCIMACNYDLSLCSDLFLRREQGIFNVFAGMHLF